MSETKLGQDDPTTLATRNNLAQAYSAAGRISEAVALLEATLKLQETKLGPDHPDTLTSVHSLAHALQAGRPTAAEPLFRRALEGYRKWQGPDGAVTIDLTRDLASLLYHTGPAAEAVALFEATLKLQETKLGPDHPDTLTWVHYLAHAIEASRPADAEPLFRRALEGFRKQEGPDGARTIDLTHDLALLLDRTGRSADAIPLHEQTLKALRRSSGLTTPPRSPLATTSPRPTAPPAAPPRLSPYLRPRSSFRRRS